MVSLHFTWPSRDLWAAINFPLRLLHTIYMNILPANLHIIIVNCVGPSLLQHAYPPHPFAAPSPLSLSFSLCVAFNQLLTLTSLARRASSRFYHWHFIYVPPSPPSLSLCLPWLPQWLSEPQSVTVSLSVWLRFPPAVSLLCFGFVCPAARLMSRLTQCCRCHSRCCRGLRRHSAAISHCIRNGL